MQLSGSNANAAVLISMLILAAGTGVSNAAEPQNRDAASGNDPAGVAELEAVQVEGRSESAWYPTDSYLATHNHSATKTDIPLIETPQSISVITQEQLEDRGADTLTKAVTYSPGIYVQNRASQNVIDSFSIDIRGFDATSSTFRDGTQIQAGLPYDSPIEVYGLERIEVLRGPASVLYGQGQPGGIINMVTKKPAREPLREMGVEYGTDDHKQFKADISDRLTANGDWRFRLTGLIQKADTHVDFINDDRIYFAPALSWEPTDNTKLTLLANYQKNETKYPWTAFPREGTKVPSEYGRIPDSRYIGEPGFDEYDAEEYSAGYIFEHSFADRWTFRQNFRYRDINYDVKDVFRDYSLGMGYVESDLRTLNRGRRIRHDEAYTVTLDNQLVSEWQHGRFEHTVLTGFDYKILDYERRDTGFNYDVSTLDLYAPVYGDDPFPGPLSFSETNTQAEQLGLYFQDHIKFGDHWALTVGGRQDWVESETTGEDKREQDELSLRGGLVYLFDNGFAPYVSYAESFTPQYDSFRFTGEQKKPITGKQYEAGLRYQPPGLGFSATAAVFEITRKNELVEDPVNPLRVSQIGETRSRGFEFELLADLTSNLQMIGSYTYQDVEVVEAGGSQATNGNQVTDRPKHLAKLWLDYTVPAGTLAGLGVGGGIRYTGTSYADAANTVKYPAATLVDASLRYDLGSARLQLNATNLFDEQKVYCSGVQPTSTCDYGLPRSVIASVTYRWQ
ncbi:iron complex outermembrane receptor protein [Methylohalomonas lacus]|uniref:Iron complex outermembrane receptor protein n=1 Tax=Methylohalomonas lacus TaxID=398773 RepID=A0AAE3HJV5_9GAMM|nr:TonB-dependent siderophore receptor [Methylohalomonas lacus]MCS3903709.1 iron complex outermembrane receptor protein [Methylohalomonas lacus]